MSVCLCRSIVRVYHTFLFTTTRVHVGVSAGGGGGLQARDGSSDDVVVRWASLGDVGDDVPARAFDVPGAPSRADVPPCAPVAICLILLRVHSNRIRHTFLVFRLFRASRHRCPGRRCRARGGAAAARAVPQPRGGRTRRATRIPVDPRYGDRGRSGGGCARGNRGGRQTEHCGRGASRVFMIVYELVSRARERGVFTNVYVSVCLLVYACPSRGAWSCVRPVLCV